MKRRGEAGRCLVGVYGLLLAENLNKFQQELNALPSFVLA
jgi:hypothetical protein